MLSKIIKDCFTEKDNETFDIVRILGTISYLSINVFAAMHLMKECHDLDFVELASGLSMMLAVVAGGITYKSKNES